MRENRSFMVTTSQHTARQFAEWGMTHAFCVPGADIGTFLEALEDEPRIRVIFATHEFSAGAMADGFSRVAGIPAVSAAVGGPGASNLTAAAAAAGRDGSSIVFVTGSPPGLPAPTLSVPGWPDDRAGFRAAGSVSLDLTQTGGLGAALKELALAIGSGRNAHLVLPLDVQGRITESLVTEPSGWFLTTPTDIRPDASQLAGRVAIAVGARALEHASAIRSLCKTAGLPVLTDMLALGVMPEDTELAFGHLSFMPHPRARAATDADHPLAADRVVALGAEGAFEIDLRAGGVLVQSVPSPAVSDWLRAAESMDIRPSPARRAWIRNLQKMSHTTNPSKEKSALFHDVIVADVAAALGPSAIYAVDAGQFHLSAPVRLRATRPRTILTGSELVSMGWSIGAAIGAKCAAPSSPVVAFLGDGSFLMHGLELTTAARYGIAVLFIVAQNGVLGSVRRRASRSGYDAPLIGPADPVGLAAACGVEAKVVNDRKELRSALEGATNLSEPRVLVVNVPELDDAALGLPTGIAWLDGKSSD